MVKCYLSLAQMDLEKAHQDASPVTNWLLQVTGSGGAEEQKQVLYSGGWGTGGEAEG